MANAIVFFLLLSMLFYNSSPKKMDLVVDVINAIDRVLDYVDVNMGKENADLVFGVAITKGQLNAARRNLTFDSNEINRVVSISGELYYLEKKCERILNVSRTKMSLTSNIYYKILQGMWRSERWTNSPAPRPLRERTRGGNIHVQGSVSLPDISYLLHEGSPNETMSDACLAEALGAYGGPVCRVSQGCYNAELGLPVARGYPLTHRLLYVHIARQNGCQSLGLLGMKKNTSDLVNDFCVDILGDALLIEKLGFPLYARDMFCEQVALCGIEGFRAFIRSEWIREILRWQRPLGCFGNNKELKDIKKRERSPRARRLRKRSESVLAYGCLLHFTSVAMAALAVNLRYLLDLRFLLI